jgi:hypothetical protein
MGGDGCPKTPAVKGANGGEVGLGGSYEGFVERPSPEQPFRFGNG